MATIALRKSAKTYNRKHERFTIVCAWCNRVQHGHEWHHEPQPRGGVGISHGICPECYRNQIERLGAHR